MSADPFVMVRAFNRMRRAGFVLSLEDGKLMIEPASNLTDSQRAFLRTHKAALVALLTDAESLADALAKAGTAGLAWREGTPSEWDDGRLLAAGEILYTTSRMVNRLGLRFSAAVAPPMAILPDTLNVAEIDALSEEAA